MYTSGVVIVAKQQPIVVRLHEMFRSGLQHQLALALQLTQLAVGSTTKASPAELLAAPDCSRMCLISLTSGASSDKCWGQRQNGAEALPGPGHRGLGCTAGAAR